MRILLPTYLGTCGNTATRKLFTRVCITGHDTLFHFHDETNVRVQKPSSDTCRYDNLEESIATKNCVIPLVILLTRLAVLWGPNLPDDDRNEEVYYRNQN